MKYVEFYMQEYECSTVENVAHYTAGLLGGKSKPRTQRHVASLATCLAWGGKSK